MTRVKNKGLLNEYYLNTNCIFSCQFVGNYRSEKPFIFLLGVLSSNA